MIATHNRVDELRTTLVSLRDRRGVEFETIVVDDASSDGTAEAVRAEFPEVTLVRFESNRGSVAARNEVLRRASGEIIVGLDDDSRFIEPDAIGPPLVVRMRAEPDLGILSFQPIGPERPERMTESGRLRGEWHCSSFAACGVAIRRSVLNKTGLLPEFFFHAYEEPDLCLRVWDAGYRVLQWNEVVVYHAFTPQGRNEQRTHRRHARNEAASVLMRYPPHLAGPAAAYKLASQLRYAMSRGPSWVWREPWVWAEVAARVPTALRHRRAVSQRAVKIVTALNRVRTADREAVWRLGDLSWREIFGGKFERAGVVS